MWQKIILCFILIGASYQQIQEDVNSRQQVDQIWSYLQLRPDDIFITPNGGGTSIKALAAEYYGDARLAPLIYDANYGKPGVTILGWINSTTGEVSPGDIISSSGSKITLPNILRCTESLPLDCIEKSFLLEGRTLSFTVTPQSTASPNPFVARSLQQAGEVDYLAAGNLAQPLMEQVHDLSPLNLKLNLLNLMKVPVWPRNGGKSSFLKAGGEISYDKKVSPYDVTTYSFSFENIFKKTFFVQVSISIGPMPQFPFYNPGEDTYIKVKVTNALTGGTTYLNSPNVSPAQGSVSILTGTGLNAPNLNITLSIDSRWGQNTAQVILEDYYGSPLTGFNNQIRRIAPYLKQTLRIKQYAVPVWNHVILSDAASGNANRGWRLVQIRDNEYSILNLQSTQAVSLNSAGFYFTVRTPSLESSNQVWTLIPAWSQNTGTVSAYFIQGAGNSCWTLDTTETALETDVYPVRLLPCDTSNTKQLFTFPNPTGNTHTWA